MTFDTGSASRRWIIPLGIIAGLTAALSAAGAPVAPAPGAPLAGTLAPVPDAATQAEAMKALRALFKPYPPARPEDRIKMARDFIEQGQNGTNSLATRFVMLREAEELSGSSGDYQTTYRAIDLASRLFATNANEEKFAMLKRIRTAKLTPATAYFAARVAIWVGWDMQRQGDYDTAARIAGIATSFSRTSEQANFSNMSETLSTEARRGLLEVERTKAAELKLAARNDDPAANAETGRFLCFWRGDWDQGLPRLAKGNEPGLKVAAEKELTPSIQPIDQFALAEQWNDLAAKETGIPRARIRERAIRRYEQSMLGLGGVERGVAQQKLMALHKLDSSDPFSTSREVLLSRALNDPFHWKAWNGKWSKFEPERGRLRGEGNAWIAFDTPLPPNVVISFNVAVVTGLRPRIQFSGTDMAYMNDSTSENQFNPCGNATKISTGGKVTYDFNKQHAFRFKISNGHFEIEADGKPAVGGTCASPTQIDLVLSSGDSWSQGTAEFYNFRVESMLP